jgi:cell division protein FtsZ
MKRKHKKSKKIKDIRPIIRKKPREISDTVHKTKMRIIGIGGGGGSIVSEIAGQLKRIDFAVANTDLQALKTASRKARVLHFGKDLTGGLGCGMEPKCGKNAASRDKDKIAKLFNGVDLAIIVAALGGGTGSGAAPEFAKIARDLGIMTLGIFTLPFKFEGARRMQIARSSLERLTPNLNAISIIPNENIFQIINKDTPIIQAFSAVNKRLAENIRGLIEMIYVPGLINIDFADLRTILDGKGKLAYLNTASSSGDNRASEAVKEALKSPLNEYNIRGAERIIFNITASDNLGMAEVELISKSIADFNNRAKIIFGVCQNNDHKDNLRISLLGIDCGKEAPKPQPVKPPPQPKPPIPAKKPKVPKKKIKLKAVKINDKVLVRKNAIDIQKEVEKTENDFFEQEKQWDIPTFLRQKEN